jgi:hypothetical protein
MPYPVNHRSHFGEIDLTGFESIEEDRVALDDVVGVVHLPTGSLPGKRQGSTGLRRREFVEVVVGGIFDVDVGDP